MELFLVVLVALGYTIQPCASATSACHSAYDAGLNKDGAFQFPVFHRDHPCVFLPSSSMSTLAEAEAEGSPVIANDAIHKGKFFMAISLGTLSVFNLVTIDTGSTLSWVQCKQCPIWCREQAPDAGTIFDPGSSATYRRVGCRSEACAAVHESLAVPYGCIQETDTCLYSLRYGPGGPMAQYSVGKLGRDTLKLTLADEFAVVDDFIFGCSQDERFDGREAGIVGFANESFSFFTQVARRANYAAFSYCFPGSSQAQGFLSIGPYARDKLAFASMKLGYGDRLVYSLQQLDMMVDGRRLKLDPSTYLTRMIIVDSGTPDTYLLSPVFDALERAIAVAMRVKGYSRRVYHDTTSCFSSLSADSVHWSDVPAVEMKFIGGTLKLPPRNVFHHKSLNLICLAFQPDVAGVRGVQILGTRSMRSFRVVYDLKDMRLGFQPDACMLYMPRDV